MTGASFDSDMFERAMLGILDSPKHDYPAYIDGLAVASGTDDPLVSPVDDTIIFGRLQDPEPGTAAKAAERAKGKVPLWSSMAGAERAAVLGKAADSVERRRYFLAAEVVLSTGMCREEALAEVDRLAEVVRKAAEDAKGIRGKPRGVIAVVGLTSSPLASPMGYAAAALAAGNAVVVMPSGRCPRPVYTVYSMFDAAGLPRGVLNLVADRLDRRVQELIGSPDVAGIVASGCGRPMEDIMFTFVDEGVYFLNEIKGMNPIIVYRPGDMEKAAADVLSSAFSYAGQHLYSCSKVIVTADEENDFVRMLAGKAKDFRVDEPGNPGAAMGPLMSDEAVERLSAFLEKYSGRVVFGGGRIRTESTSRGRYYSPVIVSGLDQEDDAQYIDPNLPVLIVRAVGSVDDIPAEIGETECGLAVGVMSAEQALISAVKGAAGGAQLFVNRSSLTLKPAERAVAGNFLARSEALEGHPLRVPLCGRGEGGGLALGIRAQPGVRRIGAGVRAELAYLERPASPGGFGDGGDLGPVYRAGDGDGGEYDLAVQSLHHLDAAHEQGRVEVLRLPDLLGINRRDEQHDAVGHHRPGDVVDLVGAGAVRHQADPPLGLPELLEERVETGIAERLPAADDDPVQGIPPAADVIEDLPLVDLPSLPRGQRRVAVVRARDAAPADPDEAAVPPLPGGEGGFDESSDPHIKAE